MSVRALIGAVVSSWKDVSAASHSASVDEESAQRPLLAAPVPSQQPHSPRLPSQTQTYGATSSGNSSLRVSPERFRRDSLLGRVPEEGGPVDGEGESTEEAEWELQEQGFYTGSYGRTVALYTLVPISSVVAFAVLLTLPILIWKEAEDDSPTDPRYFPSSLLELLVSASLWSLCHLLRLPLYNLTASIRNPILRSLAFNTVYVVLSQLLRLASFSILQIRHRMLYPLPTWQDPAFHRVWRIALGWAGTEVAVGIVQGYEQIALYRNAMVSDATAQDWLTRWKDGSSDNGQEPASLEEVLPMSPRTPGPAQDRPLDGLPNESGPRRTWKPHSISDAIRMAVDQDLEQLVNLKEREELEEIYGIPVIRIPVFVSCLQRLDSFLLSIGLTLVLAWSYLRSSLSFPDTPLPSIYSSLIFFVTFPVIAFLYLFLSLLHTPPILPRIGVHTTAYIGFIFGLGSIFTGLGLWGALS